NRGVSSLTTPIWIEVQSEQEPDPESRVTLGTQTDALGMRRARLDWRVTDLTYATIQHTAQLVVEQMQAAKMGEVKLDAWVTDQQPHWRRYIGDVYHQCGTARMG